VDSGEKMKFSSRTHTTDVWYRDRTYGLSLHGGCTHPSPDVWSLYEQGNPIFTKRLITPICLDLGFVLVELGLIEGFP
jgi:hypothetical protein